MNKNHLLTYARKAFMLATLVGMLFSAFGTASATTVYAEDTRPDLQVTDIEVLSSDAPKDPSIYLNDDIYVAITLANTGVDNTPTGFTVNIYFDKAWVSCVENTTGRAYYANAAALNGTGDTTSNNFQFWNLRFPASDLGLGDHTIDVYVDSGCAVDEVNEGNNSLSIPFTINATPGAAPLNDAIGSAVDLSGISIPYLHDTLDVRAATRHATDPDNINCAPFDDPIKSGLESVWFTYTPATDISLVLDTHQSNYNTYLAVWQGTPEALTLLGCEDDAVINVTPTSSVGVSLTGGVTYYFQVAKKVWDTTDVTPALAPIVSDAQGFVAPSATFTVEDNLNLYIKLGWRISGNVGMPSVTMTYEIDGSVKTTKSNANGDYKIIVPLDWTGTLTPTKAGYAFTPVSQDFTSVNADMTQNFITRPVLGSIAWQDGWTLESTATSNRGGLVNATQSIFILGDNAQKKQYRSILSFNTASLPNNAVITSVLLRVRKQGIVGIGNPIILFGGFMVDVKRGYFITPALTKNDFQYPADRTIGPFRPALQANNWYAINLYNARGAINRGGITQIRLRFRIQNNANALANYMKFYSGNAGAISSPKLIIRYSIP